MRDKNELRTAMADAGYDGFFFDDIAFSVAEGCDYDELCQRATDAVAEALGIRQPGEGEDWDGTEYGLVNEIANEMVSAGMAAYEEGKTEEMVAQEWAEYWEGEEYDSDSVLTEAKMADIVRMAKTMVADTGMSLEDAVRECVTIVALA